MNRREFIAITAALPLAVTTGIGSNAGSTPTVQPVAAGGKKITRFSVFTERELCEHGRDYPMLIINRLAAHGFEPRPYKWTHDILNRVWIAEQGTA